MKIVINTCFGGFGLSNEGIMHYAKLKGIEVYAYNDDIDNDDDNRSKSLVDYNKRPLKPGPGPSESLFSTHYATKPNLKISSDLNKCYFDASSIPRDDPFLVQTVEELGEQSYGTFANLEVVDIPDGVEWEIEEHDGNEHIAEYQTWG